RQNANQLEMRMRISSESPHILHYAGPYPNTSGAAEPLLALAGNSRLDGHAVEQLFQGLPKRPLVFLSYHDDEKQRVTNMSRSQMERDGDMEDLATSMLSAGAGAVLTMRWPISSLRTREFATLFYQDVADGMTLGEALRRTRTAMAQHYSDD